MEILLDLDYGSEQFPGAQVEQLAQFVLEQLDLPSTSEVSITFVNNDEIARLNEQYRGKQGPTDVLSFECDNLDDDFDDAFFPPDLSDLHEQASQVPEVYSLGDIIIAPDVVAAQAEGYGNTPTQELELMVVHGLLHLNGYDHIEDEEAEEMEALQVELLKEWRARIKDAN